MNELAIRTAIFTDEQVDVAKAALMRALSAKKTARRRKDGGQIEYVEVDDTSMQAFAAVKVIEFGRGKPISMNLNADVTPPNPGDQNGAFMQAILDDPEARRTLREVLQKTLEIADRRAPVEVTATPALPNGKNRASESSSEAPQR